MAIKNGVAVSRETLTSAKIGAPVRIAVISDLHNSRYGARQSALMRTVKGEAPDIVVCVGDIFHAGVAEENARDALSALCAAYPCYFVTGNHEREARHAERIEATVRDCGATVLAGTAERVRVNGQAVLLCGIDDPRGKDGPLRGQLKAVARALDGETFSVLLSHRPEHFARILAYGFDLMLSGHTHGGQWRLPLARNGVFAPGQGLFPQYAGGRFDFGGQTLIVSRGLSKRPYYIPRLGNPPELVLVTLAPGQ